MGANISTALKTTLTNQVTSLHRLWKIKLRAGQLVGGASILGFTDWDSDITYDSKDGDGPITYTAKYGLAPTSVKTAADMTVDNLEVVMIFDDAAITEEDMRAGRFDFAEIRVMFVNVADLTQGHLAVRSGWLGEMAVVDNSFKTELRGLTQAFNQPVGEITSATCRAQLGDSRCTVNLAIPAVWIASHLYGNDFVSPSVSNGFKYKQTGSGAGYSDTFEPSWPITVGATISDNTLTWTTYRIETHIGVIANVTDEFDLRLDLNGGVADTAITFVNPGAETGDETGWTDTAYDFQSISSDGAILPHSGTKMFELRDKTGTSTARQTTDLTIPGGLAAYLAANKLGIYVEVWVRSEGTKGQRVRLRIQTRDSLSVLLDDEVTSGYMAIGTWVKVTLGVLLSITTSTVRVIVEPENANAPEGEDATLGSITASVANSSFTVSGTPGGWTEGGWKTGDSLSFLSLPTSSLNNVNFKIMAIAGNTITVSPAPAVDIVTPDTSYSVLAPIESYYIDDLSGVWTVPGQPDSSWFTYGLLKMTSGPNAGVSREIAHYYGGSSSAHLFLPFPFPVTAGETFEAVVGCDRLAKTCEIKFQNIINFRGEPFVPGQDRYFDSGKDQ